jgi:hypothetical protein
MNTVFRDGPDCPPAAYRVVFLNASGERLVRVFDSEYQARVFTNKLKHSTRCTLVSYPNFR